METKPCRECNGTGLLRNDNPFSDRVYGEACPSCNGTGIHGEPAYGCIVLVLSVVTTVVPLIWWLW